MEKILAIGVVALMIVGSGTAFSIPIKTVSLIESKNDDGLQDSPWPMFSHDVRHTGRSPYDTSMNEGIERWKFEAEPIISSPAIAKDGTIYIGSCISCETLRGTLYAINPDGTLKWRFETSNSIDSSPAIAKDGTIYVGDDDGYLYAIYPNGTEKWSFGIHGNTFSSPAIGSDGIIYIGSNNGKLYAVYPNGTKNGGLEQVHGFLLLLPLEKMERSTWDHMTTIFMQSIQMELKSGGFILVAL